MLSRWVIIVYIMLMVLKASVYPLMSATTSHTDTELPQPISKKNNRDDCKMWDYVGYVILESEL